MAYSTTLNRFGTASVTTGKVLCLLLAMLLSCLALNASAQVAQRANQLNGVVRTLNVPLYKSRIVQLDGPVQKISVGNKEVADILVMRSNQVYVLGKGIGTTNILMWDSNNRLTQSLDVEVTPDLNSLKAKLHQLLPGETIRVNMSQGAIVLSGDVTNAMNMDTAMKIAQSFIQKPSEEGASEKGSVINLMGIGGAQQVMLKVTVAEMSRTVIKRMGIKFHSFTSGSKTNFGAVNGGATFPDLVNSDGNRIGLFPSGAVTGPAVDEFAPSNLGIEDTGLFASYLDGDFLFSLALDAAKETGLAKVLAEPTLTALTGQEAEFLSGGEFPIPVPDEDGITIEFKEFGVGLKFIPVVLDSGRINLKLNVSVSELTNTAAITFGSEATSAGFFVPALTKRSARSTVELGDGQTIGIAGLINENMRDAVNKFPGLGDVPVLGQLFRSSEFEKGETELVILVTPTLARPFNAEAIALPGDGFVEPGDLDFYLLGRSISEQPMRREDEATQDTEDGQPSTALNIDAEGIVHSASGGSESTFGHSIN